MTPRILIIDTYYPDVIKALPVDPSFSYATNLRRVMQAKFGTADFYSRHLQALGWSTCDVIANHAGLQALWAKENGSNRNTVYAQIQAFQPHVIFCQDLSFLGSGLLSELKATYVLAGQCSCPLPPAQNIKPFDVLFTSIPSHVDAFKTMGVKAVYNPLAFEESMLEVSVPSAILSTPYTISESDMARIKAAWESGYLRTNEQRFAIIPGGLDYKDCRVHDCVFIGGVGQPSHWAYGMQVLNAVAEHIPTFEWWGYGANLLPDGPLKRKYQGEAWGRAMYDILATSKIGLNRHGEIAGRFANNMKLFETTGMGALLVTEIKDNLGDFFGRGEAAAYESPMDAVAKVRYYLQNDDERIAMARAGQSRTLREHTYGERMKVIDSTLREML